MDDYLIGVGVRIKKLRKDNGKTIKNIADGAGVSNGLISRIENGRTIPSLPVLLNIINALEIEVGSFFEKIDKDKIPKIWIARKSDYQVIEKETEANGFVYHHIISKQLNVMGMEAVLLEIAPNAQREKVTTEAYEYKYILSGSVVYKVDNEEVELFEGDSLFFDGRLPHVPVNNNSEPVKMLVFYFFNKK